MKALLFLFAAACASAQQLPFTIEPGPDVSARFPDAPRLQSFAWAEWEDKWIFTGGRVTGYHGFGGADSDFPRASANDSIWVVEPSNDGPARIWRWALDRLPASLAPVADQLRSSNPLFVQDGDTLYVAGGYGQNSHGEWVTYPVLTALPLPALVSSVIHGDTAFTTEIAYTESPLVQVTGGEMLKLDDGLFYVAGGHIFIGSYSAFEASDERNTAAASQTYTGEIRRLRIVRANGALSVDLMERFAHTEFARRDFTAGYRILPGGELGAAVYGGVFTADRLNFSKPVYWTTSEAPHTDESFEQKMSAYSCAHVSLFDPSSNTTYTTFFGGISRWLWNYHARTFELAPRAGEQNERDYQDGLAWIDHITTLAHAETGAREIVGEHRLPAYIGANAAFLPVPGLIRVRDDAPVFDLSRLNGRVLLGYLYGGIRAFPKEFPFTDQARPYRSGGVPTRVNDLIVPVYLVRR